MDCDLVLEGGGVKGIGLAGAVTVLAERGYRFRRVAGTSAGALVGALVAAGVPAGRLAAMVDEIDYAAFQDPGWLDRVPVVGKALSVLFENGVYEGDAVRAWVEARLMEAGVRTFADLRIDDDAGTALPPGRRYRLVVMASDVSTGRLVRLPWDYARYGLDPDEQLVADAVRASTAIPFFYEPVTLEGASGRSVLVDGGLLSNFPIDAFDRTDGRRPRWPTIGVKLSARPEANQVPRPVNGPLGMVAAMVRTMVNARDQMHLDDPCVVDRTIFVDTGRIDATDFDLDRSEQRLLYENGRAAAGRFLDEWDWEDHLARCRGVAEEEEAADGRR